MTRHEIATVEERLRKIDPGITEDDLRAAAAAAREMTPEDRLEQMISFILGTMSSRSTMTREEVIQYLEKRRCW
jgi:hypothetical protein